MPNLLALIKFGLFLAVMLPVALFILPFIVVTSPIWFPALLTIYIIIKIAGIDIIARKKWMEILVWACYKSVKTRRYIWKKAYNYLMRVLPTRRWSFMNCGYAIDTETGMST